MENEYHNFNNDADYMSGASRGTTHIVTGLSSGGKSTFIHSVLLPQLAHKSPQVFFPSRSDYLRQHSSEQEGIIHYNLTRLYKFIGGQSTIPYLNDPFMQHILKWDTHLKFYILVVQPSVLAERILNRRQLEPLFGNPATKYPFKRFYRQLQEQDYIGVYGVFFSFLNCIDADYQIIDTSHPDYRQLHTRGEVFSLLRVS